MATNSKIRHSFARRKASTAPLHASTLATSPAIKSAPRCRSRGFQAGPPKFLIAVPRLEISVTIRKQEPAYRSNRRKPGFSRPPRRNLPPSLTALARVSNLAASGFVREAAGEHSNQPMDNIQITLPDGATREVPKGTTAAEIARQISPRLAKEALVARTNGDLIDLSRPLDHDTKLAILTAKDPDAVQVFRHSAAHLLAAAVMELYPERKAGHRPADRHRIFLRVCPRRPVHSG